MLGPAGGDALGGAGCRRATAPNATIKGFEVMRALRKGQAAIFNLTRDMVGEARLVERAFGLGARALTEAVQLVSERIEAA
jgi:transposase, IS6 family